MIWQPFELWRGLQRVLGFADVQLQSGDITPINKLLQMRSMVKPQSRDSRTMSSANFNRWQSGCEVMQSSILYIALTSRCGFLWTNLILAWYAHLFDFRSLVGPLISVQSKYLRWMLRFRKNGGRHIARTSDRVPLWECVGGGVSSSCTQGMRKQFVK